MKDEDGDELTKDSADDDEDWRREESWRCWWRTNTAIHEYKLGLEIRNPKLLPYSLPHFNLKKKNRIPGIQIYKYGIRIRLEYPVYKPSTRPEYPLFAIRVNYRVLTTGYKIFWVGFCKPNFFEHP